MRKLSIAFMLAVPLVFMGGANADEWDACARRPIDNILGAVADHSYCWKWCTNGMCNGESYNQATDTSEDQGLHASPDGQYTCAISYNHSSICGCAGKTDCSYPAQAWEVRNSTRTWGYNCGDWINAAHYGGYASWGVCHQAAANVAWYLGDAQMGNLTNAIRAWSVSVGAYGYYGTDGGC